MLTCYFYLIFMIPVLFMVNCWFIYQFMFIFILMYMYCYMDFSSFFCGLGYLFGIDFISFGMIILTFFVLMLMILSSINLMESNYSFFFLFLLLMIGICLVFIFSVLNIFIMYLFFEFSLVPLMILMLGWGYQPERLISGMYLLFYTLFASLPLLLVIIYIYNEMNTLYFDLCFSFSTSFFFHFCSIFAFLVSLPMFMFHFWLPKAHVQAPVSGSMILAGLMLKIGGYGLIRFMFLYEYLFLKYSYIWYSFCIVGTILVSIICLMQGDVKCLIAYSSVSHMGLCLMGLLSMKSSGLFGSYLMMFSHGLCSSGLFCLSNICYIRLSSRSFFLNKGLINFMPSMCLLWFLFCCFNMSCPPSLNFVGEIYILVSMISYWWYSFFYFFFISFFSACFSFYLFSYTQHGCFHDLYSYSSGKVSEFILMIFHLIPLFFFLFCLDFFFW
uniref:NADH-ubiquinone oxidoreductase chain 4 n=1 Tax=Signoretia aureola TaxID=2901393 RepID=A0A8K2ATZ2_9HEMI|nr:NADH dehydrogenase subunit 4 [Signoretia aureola]